MTAGSSATTDWSSEPARRQWRRIATSVERTARAYARDSRASVSSSRQVRMGAPVWGVFHLSRLTEDLVDVGQVDRAIPDQEGFDGVAGVALRHMRVS